MQRLGGGSMAGWLMDKGYTVTDENIQAYRHRFLDALIAEFELQLPRTYFYVAEI